MRERVPRPRSCPSPRSFRRGISADLHAALRDPVWQVRAQAATALGRLGDPGAVDDLEHAMADRSWWVRTNAAIALGELGEAGAIALERVAAGRDPYAAERAREALQGVAA